MFWHCIIYRTCSKQIFLVEKQQLPQNWWHCCCCCCCCCCYCCFLLSFLYLSVLHSLLPPFLSSFLPSFHYSSLVLPLLQFFFFFFEICWRFSYHTFLDPALNRKNAEIRFWSVHLKPNNGTEWRIYCWRKRTDEGFSSLLQFAVYNEHASYTSKTLVTLTSLETEKNVKPPPRGIFPTPGAE